MGEVGEVVFRGDSVMAGYWRNPEATAAAIRDGWLWTGDMGCLDADGFLTLKDRSKDLIISGGSNIYPREVEEVLLTAVGVSEVAVVGAPNPEWGEIIVAFVVLTVIMIFVIPSFKEVFSSFGADLPAPTLFVIALSEFFVEYWYLIFGGLGGGFYFFMQAWKRNEKVQMFMDRLLLRIPIFGPLVEKSVIARWTRTLATMFAAGVPLVEALDSVGGASGNSVFLRATDKIQQEVSTGTSLTNAMTNANLFPSMVLQMCAIGEESGSIDHMLGKAADFYEAEVDDMVAGLSSLMEPVIIVVLGTVIGGIVVSMYLPIFKLGQVV